MDLLFLIYLILFFVAGIVVIMLILSTQVGSVLLKFLYRNERISPCSNTAQNNVTLLDALNGMRYKPLSVEPIGEEEFDVRVESTEAPFRETVLRLKRGQFKHDPIKVVETGLVNYRLVRPELTNPDHGLGDEKIVSPTLTKDEMKVVSEVNFKKIIELEGDLSNQKANVQEQVRDIIDNTTKVQNSKFGGNT